VGDGGSDRGGDGRERAIDRDADLCQAGSDVDVIVGRGVWIGPILARRLSITETGHPLAVVDCADLVLLKLFARGPQDLLDVRLLLAAASASLRRQVEERLPQAPASVREAWQELATSAL
jgi:hypothetical protein